MEQSLSLSTFPVVFLRNVTNQHIVTFLKYLATQENLRLIPDLSGYDDALEQVISSCGLLQGNGPKLVIVNQYERLLMPRLTTAMIRMSAAEIKDETDQWKDHLSLLLEATRSRTTAPILVHALEPILEPTLGILDHQINSGQTALWAELNGWLAEKARDFEECYILDMNQICCRLGWEKYFDLRYWHLGQSPYSVAASEEIAHCYMAFIRAITGKQRKCLVLDCDNTLWGGVVGEVGVSGIKLGKTYPGSAFRDFQNIALNFHSRGILLALCSKNNESDVLEVFERHPEMLLRLEHLAAWRVNWRDKPNNLQEIAAELNIGIDSLVLADDSAFEVSMVRQMLPEIQVLHLDGEPAGFAGKLAATRLFDSLGYSNEDRQRNAMYQIESKRKNAIEEFGSSDKAEYFRYLKMEVTICDMDDFSLPRAAQLTQRTNQFNLMTVRYSEGEMKSYVSAGKGRVLCLSLKDRFGDMGMVGLAMLRFDGTNAHVDNLMLSCRVIGRGAEDVLLHACKLAARTKSANTLIGRFVATAKNQQVTDFYIKRRFIPSADGMFYLSLMELLPLKSNFCSIELPSDISH